MSSTARKLDHDGHEPESIILVREAARKRESRHRHAAPAPRPRLLPKKATAAAPQRRVHLGVFAVICLAIVTIGLVSMLIVNTMLASGAFTVSKLQGEKALLLEQEQQLIEEVAVASSGVAYTADTTTTTEPIVAMIFGQAGLIAGATLEGTKYTRIYP